jgi:hypothetical protein
MHLALLQQVLVEMQMMMMIGHPCLCVSVILVWLCGNTKSAPLSTMGVGMVELMLLLFLMMRGMM